jgi:hypothetical protein
MGQGQAGAGRFLYKNLLIQRAINMPGLSVTMAQAAF